MNASDLSSLEKVDSEFQKLSMAIKESYRGDWDDAVHRSYGLYIKKVEQNATKIRMVNRQASQIIKAAASLGVERLSKNAEELRRETELI